jgi:hypothetical protein
MATHPEPSLDELLWTVAAARIVLGAHMNIQAPPNLTPAAAAAAAAAGGADADAGARAWRALVDAGINDWGEMRAAAAAARHACVLVRARVGACAAAHSGRQHNTSVSVQAASRPSPRTM